MQHTIQLNDFHPGEYTRWTLDQENPKFRIELKDSEDFVDANDSMAQWTLIGEPKRLLALYNELLENLARVTWDWYGLGGDDNCYDYWPNSMHLAADFRDALIPILSEDDRPAYRIDYVQQDLNAIYWLARMRYANMSNMSQEDAAALTERNAPIPVQDANQCFESDILEHARFGDCPSWIIFTKGMPHETD